MEITKHTEAAVIVSSEWRYLPGLKRYLGQPDDPQAAGGGSSTLEGQILDAVDPLGLWFELNSEKKKWPDRPVQKLMIPWKFILAIVLEPDLEGKSKGVGYPVSSEEISGSPESTGGKFAV